MKRKISALALFLALVWASGALAVIHHLAERHEGTVSSASVTLVATGTGDGAADDHGACALCIALAAGKYCEHDTQIRLETAAVSVETSRETCAHPEPTILSLHNRGPPALLG